MERAYFLLLVLSFLKMGQGLHEAVGVIFADRFRALRPGDCGAFRIESVADGCGFPDLSRTAARRW